MEQELDTGTDGRVERLALTAPRIQALLPEGKPRVLAVGDGAGLCLCIAKNGVGQWKLRYRHGGTARWLTLGRYSPQTGIKLARKEVTKQRVRIAEGVDPVGERRTTKLALRTAKMVRDLSQHYTRAAAGAQAGAVPPRRVEPRVAAECPTAPTRYRAGRAEGGVSLAASSPRSATGGLPRRGQDGAAGMTLQGYTGEPAARE